MKGFEGSEAGVEKKGRNCLRLYVYGNGAWAKNLRGGLGIGG